MIKRTLLLQPGDKLRSRPVTAPANAYRATESPRSADVAHEYIFFGDIPAVLLFSQSLICVVVSVLDRFRCRGERLRRAVGGAAEFHQTFLRRARVLSRIFTISKVIRRLNRFRRRGERLRHAVGGATELHQTFLRRARVLSRIFTISKVIRRLNCLWRRCEALRRAVGGAAELHKAFFFQRGVRMPAGLLMLCQFVVNIILRRHHRCRVNGQLH